MDVGRGGRARRRTDCCDVAMQRRRVGTRTGTAEAQGGHRLRQAPCTCRVPWLATREGAIAAPRAGVTRGAHRRARCRHRRMCWWTCGRRRSRSRCSRRVRRGRPRFARLALADGPGIDVRTEVRVAPGMAVRTTAPPRPATAERRTRQVLLVGGVEALTSGGCRAPDDGGARARTGGGTARWTRRRARGRGGGCGPTPTGTRAHAPDAGRGPRRRARMEDARMAGGAAVNGRDPLAYLESGVVGGRARPGCRRRAGRAGGRTRRLAVSCRRRCRVRGGLARAGAASGARTCPRRSATTAWVSGHGRAGLCSWTSRCARTSSSAGAVMVTAGVGADAGAPMALRQVEAWAMARRVSRSIDDGGATGRRGPSRVNGSWDRRAA